MITCPYDWLLIRATKDLSPTLPRLRRIWEARCAMPTEYRDKHDEYIATRLLGILAMCGDQTDGRYIMDIIRSVAPDQAWKINVDENAPYWERVVLALASVIRCKMVDEFPSYRIPARFRNKQKSRA